MPAGKSRVALETHEGTLAPGSEIRTFGTGSTLLPCQARWPRNLNWRAH